MQVIKKLSFSHSIHLHSQSIGVPFGYMARTHPDGTFAHGGTIGSLTKKRIIAVLSFLIIGGGALADQPIPTTKDQAHAFATYLVQLGQTPESYEKPIISEAVHKLPERSRQLVFTAIDDIRNKCEAVEAKAEQLRKNRERMRKDNFNAQMQAVSYRNGLQTKQGIVQKAKGYLKKWFGGGKEQLTRDMLGEANEVLASALALEAEFADNPIERCNVELAERVHWIVEKVLNGGYDEYLAEMQEIDDRIAARNASLKRDADIIAYIEANRDTLTIKEEMELLSKLGQE